MAWPETKTRKKRCRIAMIAVAIACSRYVVALPQRAARTSKPPRPLRCQWLLTTRGHSLWPDLPATAKHGKLLGVLVESWGDMMRIDMKSGKLYPSKCQKLCWDNSRWLHVGDHAAMPRDLPGARPNAEALEVLRRQRSPKKSPGSSLHGKSRRHSSHVFFLLPGCMLFIPLLLVPRILHAWQRFGDLGDQAVMAIATAIAAASDKGPPNLHGKTLTQKTSHKTTKHITASNIFTHFLRLQHQNPQGNTCIPLPNGHGGITVSTPFSVALQIVRLRLT